MEARVARRLHELRGLLHALDPADRLLHVRVEILHAHRDPVEAELRERLDLRARRDRRVDLDRLLAVLREVEAAREDLVAALELLLVEEGGRPAAPVELGDGAPAGQPLRDELDLLVEELEVGLGAGAVVRGDDVAAAEPAHLAAERDVDVDRERAALGVGEREVLLVLPRPERVLPLGRGRVARVPRAGTVVLLDELPGAGSGSRRSSLPGEGVDRVHDRLHVLGRRGRRQAVAEVEDVAGLRPRRPQRWRARARRRPPSARGARSSRGCPGSRRRRRAARASSIGMRQSTEMTS